jgi:ankyrin repeat protein
MQINRDIDEIIIGLVDSEIDLSNLAQVSWYWFNLVKGNKLYIAFKEFIPKLKSKLKHEGKYKLIDACVHGCLGIAQFYYKIYASLLVFHDNRYFYAYESAFMEACAYNQTRIAEWLFYINKENSTPINININNYYAFKMACNNGQTETVGWLLQKSIEIKSPIDNSIYNNAFYIVCTKGHIAVAKLLLQKNIEMNLPVTTFTFTNAIAGAHMFDHLDVVEWLLQKSIEMNIFIDSDTINRVFMYSCGNGIIELVKHFLQKKYKPNINIHYMQDSPFEMACNNGHFKIVQLLLQKCIELKSPIDDNVYFRALNVTFHNHTDIFNYLVGITNYTAIISSFFQNIIQI